MHYAPFYAYETAVARHRNAGCQTTKAAVLRKTAQKSGNRMRKYSYELSAARACAIVTEDLCNTPLYAGTAPIEKRVFCRSGAMQKRSGGRRFGKSHSESIRIHNFVRHLVAGLVGRQRQPATFLFERTRQAQAPARRWSSFRKTAVCASFDTECANLTADRKSAAAMNGFAALQEPLPVKTPVEAQPPAPGRRQRRRHVRGKGFRGGRTYRICGTAGSTRSNHYLLRKHIL